MGGKSPGLWAFVATAALWGLISLVTPCVFPMIPITVSIFLKQAHGSFRERLKLAFGGVSASAVPLAAPVADRTDTRRG